MSTERKRNNHEYWYFRLTVKDVFDADVQQIKNIPGIGYVIFVIYIELCARSVKNGGYFVINRTSPQNGYAADLARLINEDPSNTGHALSYLSAHGFVEILENDYEVVLHIPIVDNNTGKSSLEADRVRALDRQKRQTEKVSSSDEIGKKRHNNKRKKSTNPSVRQQPPTPRKPTAKPTNEAKTATKKPTGLKEILAKPLGWLKKITGSER